MRKRPLLQLWLTVAALAAFGLAALLRVPALAQSGGSYDLTWNSVDSGGGLSTGGDYVLQGTLGQADAGSLSGGGYVLVGGYQAGTGAVHATSALYLPLILR